MQGLLKNHTETAHRNRPKGRNGERERGCIKAGQTRYRYSYRQTGKHSPDEGGWGQASRDNRSCDRLVLTAAIHNGNDHLHTCGRDLVLDGRVPAVMAAKLWWRGCQTDGAKCVWADNETVQGGVPQATGFSPSIRWYWTRAARCPVFSMSCHLFSPSISQLFLLFSMEMLPIGVVSTWQQVYKIFWNKIFWKKLTDNLHAGGLTVFPWKNILNITTD